MAMLIAIALMIGVAQGSWFTDEMKESVTQQLAVRLGEIAREPVSDAKLTEGARYAAGLMFQRVTDVGEKELIARAPKLAKLKLPGSRDRHLEAMARYQVCAGVMMLRHQNRSEAQDADTRLTAAMGPAALGVATTFLLTRFIAQGGSTAKAEEFLTGTGMDAALTRMQDSPALFADADRECRPLMALMLD
jgi:hypothetical protein